ncbi:MAG: carboxypeptidase-like regulatory domain-containing protein [Bacteroidales bacterium]|jgi:outer membrane receptor for ferrienterochelin and colicins|nr:carboxypeptidase-like regulatory domain-containing protein [Bacteroidales bacterium]
MKKAINIFAIVVLATFGIAAFADNNPDLTPKSVKITGQVIDKVNQEALAGALVKVEGTDIEVYTDFDGNFSIEGITPDKYTLKCSLISYTECEKEICIDTAGETVEIELENFTSK